MNNGAFCLTMNGGTNGALVLNKKIYYNANDTYVGEVIWTGDNQYPCEYVAAFTVSGARPVYWKKTGKGTWRFTTSTARSNAGVVATEKGRIEYDSIAEKGGASALGTSGWLLSEYYGSAVDDSKSVPYAYLLGDGTNTVDADTATMKYIGSEDKMVTTRPVALKGAGRFSSAAAALEWTGFTSAQADGNTLVLAGEAAGCAALAVTNGAGTLSVVKEGAGDWTIKGDYDFSGGAVSQGGTLTLAGNNYTWYRLSLMQNYGDYDKGDTGTPLKDRPNCDGNNIWLSQFGLFDAAGSNLIVELTHNTAANGDTAALQPGQTALGSSDFVQMGSGDAYALTNLFNSAQTPFGGR
ncbi:MAG: hypothetical protein PHG71_07195, partial [Kiritimatiellae bacterium]|nr:hypothetical protein [Kiritimatiellia bacterium]